MASDEGDGGKKGTNVSVYVNQKQQKHVQTGLKKSGLRIKKIEELTPLV